GMFNYVLENDSSLLYNTTNDALYSTTRFYEDLEADVFNEENFFKEYEHPLDLSNPIDNYLKDDYHWREYLTQILTNLYIHKTTDKSLLELQNCIETFIDVDENRGI